MAKHPPLPRKNQPTGLAGRWEATRPPTTALNVRHIGKITALTSADLLRKASATAQAIKTTVSPQTDQASQEVARVLNPLTPRSCSLVPSVTTSQYRTSVSPPLRRTVRRYSCAQERPNFGEPPQSEVPRTVTLAGHRCAAAPAAGLPGRAVPAAPGV